MSDADMMMKFLAERIAVKSGPTTRSTLTAPNTSRTEHKYWRVERVAA